MENLRKQIEDIDHQISELEEKKEEIRRRLLDSASDEIERFKIWYKSLNKSPTHGIPDSEIIRENLYQKDLRRYQTYHIGNLYESGVQTIFDDEGCGNFQINCDIDSLTEIPILLEFMNEDVKSFIYDW